MGEGYRNKYTCVNGDLGNTGTIDHECLRELCVCARARAAGQAAGVIFIKGDG